MGFLLTASIAATVCQANLFNYLGKKECKAAGDSYRFNSVAYILCIIIFAFLAVRGQVSWFSVGLGLLYGIMNAVSNGYSMRAYGAGPMHLTILCCTSSMIIPTMSGVFFFGEDFSLIKFIGIIALLFFIYFTVGKGEDDKKVNKKWLMYCAFAIVSTGMIGVLQKIHQGSELHKSETDVFLLTGFICSFVYASVMAKKNKAQIKINAKKGFFALVCGLCLFTAHYLNLGLSGKLPSQLFFPLVNATPMILNIIMSVVLFKEKITKKQIVGIVGGIASLACICMFN